VDERSVGVDSNSVACCGGAKALNSSDYGSLIGATALVLSFRRSGAVTHSVPLARCTFGRWIVRHGIAAPERWNDGFCNWICGMLQTRGGASFAINWRSACLEEPRTCPRGKSKYLRCWLKVFPAKKSQKRLALVQRPFVNTLQIFEMYLECDAQQNCQLTGIY